MSSTSNAFEIFGKRSSRSRSLEFDFLKKYTKSNNKIDVKNMFPILINLFLLDLALETFSLPLLLDVNNIIIDKKNDINNIINR